VRAALCTDADTARGARRWNDANVLAFGLRLTTETLAIEMVDAFLGTEFDPTEADLVASLEHPRGQAGNVEHGTGKRAQGHGGAGLDEVPSAQRPADPRSRATVVEGRPRVGGRSRRGRSRCVGRAGQRGRPVLPAHITRRTMPLWLRDSKLLHEVRREAIFEEVAAWCAYWAVGHADGGRVRPGGRLLRSGWPPFARSPGWR